MDGRNVFVIHGRNEAARVATFQFLRSIGLQPLEWSQIVAATGKGSPYVGEVIDKGFEMAQAAVAVMTPDDVAKLRKQYHRAKEPKYEAELTAQPRQNVLFEAGMAMGKYESRTILVQLGDLRPMSDILGRHVVRMDNSIDKRHELVQRLKTAGCTVDDRGMDWHNEGDFETCVPDEPDVENDSNTNGSFIEYFDGLSDTELYWLVQAVAKREQTIHGYMNDTTPRALSSKRLMELVGSETTHKMRPNLYTIPPTVWRYLLEHEVPLLEQAIAKNQGHSSRLENLTNWLRVAKEREAPPNPSVHAQSSEVIEAERLRVQNEADALQLAQFRQALVYHADHVPSGMEFGYEAGLAWLHGADKILEGISSQHIKSIFHRGVQNEHDIQVAAASLRAVAARVQAKDLHK